MDITLIIPLLVSFFVTLLVLPFWIKRANREGLVGKDLNKYKNAEVAEGGGFIVIAGFMLGALIYIAITAFHSSPDKITTEIFASLTTILLVVMIGMTDTFLGGRLAKVRHKSGLGRKMRTFLVLFSAIPLIVINVGRSDVVLPFIGSLNLGIFYPLILIPLGIAGATTTYNFLAGYNGLEAGQGVIILSSLALVAYFTGNAWISMIALCMVLSLLAFLLYNLNPANVFPGDALTYGIGGLIAIMAILGNFEKIAVFFFIPYILEVILKARGGFNMQSFGKPMPDGSLDLKYKKLYGLEHVAIWSMKKAGIKPTESRVVYSIWAFQILVIIVGFIIFRKGIF